MKASRFHHGFVTLKSYNGSMRCDLHVHTVHSGMCTVPVLTRICKESYNDPIALYETLKRRGMDLVTVTDHDSIDAVEPLRHHPDFFLSEEVTCTMPSGTEMHAGVYGISERDHVELQRRRTDVPSLLAYAVERRLFVTVNHIYSSLTGSRTEMISQSSRATSTVWKQSMARYSHAQTGLRRALPRLSENQDWRERRSHIVFRG